MSDAEQKSETTARPRRRFVRLVGVAVVLCVLALLAVLTIWANRPRWYTFVSKPTTSHPGYALEFRVPVGWECIQHTVGWNLSDRAIWVNIERKPLVGFAQWWAQYILRRSNKPISGDDCVIKMGAVRANVQHPVDPGHEIRDEMQSIKQRLMAQYFPTSFRTFEHPLGPALDSLCTPRSGIHSGGMVYDWEDITDIWWNGKHRIVLINAFSRGANADFSWEQSIWKEIVRSIRVVQK